MVPRTVVRYGYRAAPCEMSSIKLGGGAALGRQEIAGVFHGSPQHYEQFAIGGYASVGIHFGDLAQAKYFAGDKGQIIKANLHFENLFDVQKSDLGWTSEKMVAHVLKLLMGFSVGIIPEEFDRILNGVSSTSEIKVTTRISGEGARQLVALLDAHAIDGIKYTNRNEPPGGSGGVAYFVLRTSQITLVDRDTPVSGKFDLGAGASA